MSRLHAVSDIPCVATGAAVLFTLLAATMSWLPAHAAIVNEAEAVANWKGTIVRSEASSQSVEVSPMRLEMRLTISVDSVRQAFPGIYQVEYSLKAENIGTATLRGIRFSDDPVLAFSPARLISRPAVTVSGFSVPGQDRVEVNHGFDGIGDKQLLSREVRLAPGEAGEINLRVNVASMPGELGFVAAASATSAGRVEPISSEEASVSAGIMPHVNLPAEAGELSAGIETVFGPVEQAGNRALVTYRLTAIAGDGPVEELSLRQDLATSFGSGNYRVVSLRANSVPEEFAATANPFFNGETDMDLLTSGGDLKPGEMVALDLTLAVSAAGTFGNGIAVRAGGLDPSGSVELAPAEARLETRHPAAARRDVSLLLDSELEEYRPGERVSAVLTLSGKGETTDIVVEMPQGFTYLVGTADIDGILREPAVSGGDLAWTGLDVESGSSIRFDMAAGPESGSANDVLRAYGRDTASGAINSEIAEMSLRRDGDAVFDCVEIAGSVFEDRNRDGYRGDDEPGLAGVEIARSQGGPVLSDRDGDFRFSCPSIAREEFGKRTELTLNTKSLPPGYHSTTDNPVRIELKRGRATTAGFGMARLRPVAFRIDADSFADGGTELNPQSLATLAGLINRLQERSSVLQIVYRGDPDSELAQERVAATRALADGAWRADQRPFSLTIETAIEE